MAQTISVLSLKGGTGKTTMVRTLADVFGRAGLDVLCVDLDPQGNLSDYLDVPPDASPTVADVLTGAATIAEAERSLSGRMGREQVLRKALRAARREHDVILVDSPPALGLLTINGLVAADWALVSSEAQYFALQGVDAALEAVEQVREYYNDDLAVLGVALNIADLRTTHSRKAHDTLVEHYGERVLATIIRASIAYAESAEQGLSILDHRPDLGADYLALADEVLDRIGERAARSRLASLREAAAA